MYDAAYPSEATALQRARGCLRLGFRLRDDRTVLRDLYQQGCLKARLPRPERGANTTAVLLNTGGGIAGGDALEISVNAEAGSALTVTSQAAERIYRALPDDPPSRIATSLAIAAGARLEWLPQETILFDAARLQRRLTIAMAADARFLGTEMLVFGRAAMGETLRRGSLHDRFAIHRDGHLLWQDAIRLQGDIAAVLDRKAIGNGARALATLVLAAPEAETLLEPLRDALAAVPASSGASAWNGMLVARILAPNEALLRRAVMAGLTKLRQDRPPPRLWLT